MPLVPAKCPECGGLVEVDNEKRAGLCQHCGQPFVIEDAIQTFNTYYNTTNNYNTTHNYGDGAVVNVYEDKNKDFVIEAGVLKEYHGESVDVVIPNNVFEISFGCFGSLPIVQITIPKTVTMIHYQNWTELAKLSKIIVDEKNLQFKTINGILFNKITDELLFFPPALVNENMNYIVSNNIHKLSYIAEEQANHFNSFVYDDIDYLNLFCTDTNNIDFARNNGFPYKITQHNYEKGKCIHCGAYNIITSKTFNLGSSYIDVYCLSDDVIILSQLYCIMYGDPWEWELREVKKDNLEKDDIKFLDAIKSDSDIYSYVKNAKDLFISNKQFKDRFFHSRVPSIVTLFDSLEELYVNEDCISKSAFENCTFLRKITIGAKCRRIEDFAFENCTSLRKITIGSECCCIEESAFKNCQNLNEINIIYNNKYDDNFNFRKGLPNEFENIHKIVIKVLPDYSIEKLKGFFQWFNMGEAIFSKTGLSSDDVILENVTDEVKWKVFSKCRYCGGELKIRLFKKDICKNCGKEQ